MNIKSFNFALYLYPDFKVVARPFFLKIITTIYETY
jgi:hypothetical protein